MEISLQDFNFLSSAERSQREVQIVKLEMEKQAMMTCHEQEMAAMKRERDALLADRMAEVLGISAKWKVFEQLWHRSNMRNDYNTAIEQQQCDEHRKNFSRAIHL